LLSLKRYQAAATDARRAIALAPTFGKAHARLGQALYFQKQYPAAVAAYQDALEYEPDNAVTQSYLEKAKHKLEKMQRKEVESVSTQLTPSHSVFTDHAEQQTTAVIRQTAMHSGRSALVSAAAARDVYALPAEDDDPDFEEALRIQKRANDYLTRKQYRAAIEEYTAALFLVPDDFHLSPDLHLGRAHALNGSRRHESARNDCLLAIKLNPSPAAYSTLAKSLFYMREYAQAVDAFEKCQDLLPHGETLGMFDQAYLEKAKAALEEEEYSLKEAGTVSGKSSVSKTVPKLPPPRFVPREEALQASPQVPPMPKSWPQQSPTSTTFHCGEERTIVFGSEALGVKLNRGSDGIVRVLHVAPSTPGSLFVRHGDLYVGDVVREAAGVDLRRPLTNIMWGDTVALIKLAPRPITMLVAKELSPVPAAVLQEHERELAQWPSPSNGDEEVVSGWSTYERVDSSTLD
jgi:tetratricopeptide (TPR) repeat protein